MKASYPEIAKLGTILGIWAHPDDESWCAGALLAGATANGQRVVCVTATKGEAGVQDESRWPAATLAETREKELKEALDVLGITEHHWLGYRDGHCQEVDSDEAAAKLVAIINEVQPDTIVTFGPDGLTGHKDHQAVSHWTNLAVVKAGHTPTILHRVDSQEWYDTIGKRLSAKIVLYYPDHQPYLVPERELDVAFHPPKELAERKLQALRVQACQMERMFKVIDAKEQAEFASLEGFVRVKDN